MILTKKVKQILDIILTILGIIIVAVATGIAILVGMNDLFIEVGKEAPLFIDKWLHILTPIGVFVGGIRTMVHKFTIDKDENGIPDIVENEADKF